jgi:hypothetical protein
MGEIRLQKVSKDSHLHHHNTLNHVKYTPRSDVLHVYTWARATMQPREQVSMPSMEVPQTHVDTSTWSNLEGMRATRCSDVSPLFSIVLATAPQPLFFVTPQFKERPTDVCGS